MSEAPIYDLLEVQMLAERARRLARALDGYDYGSDLKETPMSVLDTLRTDFETVIAKAEDDAAKVQKYEAEPLVQGVLDMLEAVPEARDILTPVLAGLGKLAAMNPPAEDVAADVPAEPAGDPQLQTGIAV